MISILFIANSGQGQNSLGMSGSSLVLVCATLSPPISFNLTKVSVVRSPEDAACAGGFDYVLLCVKALPDVYDLAAVIESVVTPQHTCILVNTTNSLGIEPFLQTRYPSNVILSLVSGASISQVGPSEFEHLGNSDVWVGSTIKNSEIPTSVQMDMAEALALTLISGNVECHVSTNIRQQQWEKMIG